MEVVTRDLYNLNLPAKLMVFHRQLLFNSAIAAIMQSRCGFLLSRCHPFYRIAVRNLKLLTCSNFWPFMLISACTDVVRLHVGHDLDLSYADFHSTCCCSVCESVGTVLKLTIAAALNIDAIGES